MKFFGIHITQTEILLITLLMAVVGLRLHNYKMDLNREKDNIVKDTYARAYKSTCCVGPPESDFCQINGDCYMLLRNWLDFKILAIYAGCDIVGHRNHHRFADLKCIDRIARDKH